MLSFKVITLDKGSHIQIYYSLYFELKLWQRKMPRTCFATVKLQVINLKFIYETKTVRVVFKPLFSRFSSILRIWIDGINFCCKETKRASVNSVAPSLKAFQSRKKWVLNVDSWSMYFKK